MNMRVEDIICNRCKGVYRNTDRTLAVLYGHCYFTICPKCTKEVAELMGYTEETLTKQLSLINYAETENNKKREIEQGDRCSACEERYKKGEDRIKRPDYTTYHITCYKP